MQYSEYDDRATTLGGEITSYIANGVAIRRFALIIQIFSYH